jgi:hypothetical protein
VGVDAGGARLVGERSGPLQGPARVVVEAAGGRLPGQHLHGHGGVGRVAQLLAELGRLAGVGDRAGVVPEPGAAGGHQGQPGDQHAKGAALARRGQPAFAQGHDIADIAQEAGCQPQVDQVPRVVAERWRLQQLQDVGEQRPAGRRVAADRQGDPARELGQGPLPGVAQPEPGVPQLGQRPDPLGAVGQLGRGGQQLGGPGDRPSVLLEHSEGGEHLGAGGPAGGPVQDPGRQGPGPLHVPGQEGVAHGGGQPLGRPAGVGDEQGRALQGGRGGREPPAAANPRRVRSSSATATSSSARASSDPPTASARCQVRTVRAASPGRAPARDGRRAAVGLVGCGVHLDR